MIKVELFLKCLAKKYVGEKRGWCSGYIFFKMSASARYLKYAALRIESKDWSKSGVLVWYEADLIIISLNINLFSRHDIVEKLPTGVKQQSLTSRRDISTAMLKYTWNIIEQLIDLCLTPTLTVFQL